jgi:hypothetical protein
VVEKVLAWNAYPSLHPVDELSSLYQAIVKKYHNVVKLQLKHAVSKSTNCEGAIASHRKANAICLSQNLSPPVDSLILISLLIVRLPLLSHASSTTHGPTSLDLVSLKFKISHDLQTSFNAPTAEK